MSSAGVLMTVSPGSVAVITRRICSRLETLCSALLAMERNMRHMVTGLKPGGGGDMVADVIEGRGVNLSLLRGSLLSTGCGPESRSERRCRHARGARQGCIRRGEGGTLDGCWYFLMDSGWIKLFLG